MQTETMQTQEAPPNGDPTQALIAKFGYLIGLDPSRAQAVLMSTIMPSGTSKADVAAFLAVVTQYKLNPLRKEIYAFPSKGGGVQPIVGIDGWLKMANDHQAFDGMEEAYEHDAEGNVLAITVKVYRKDRSRPITATEWMSECKRNTDPWRTWPNRMLLHKATIQALRRAFNFSGIMDPDEAERLEETQARTVDAKATAKAPADQAAEQLGLGDGGDDGEPVFDVDGDRSAADWFGDDPFQGGDPEAAQ